MEVDEPAVELLAKTDPLYGKLMELERLVASGDKKQFKKLGKTLTNLTGEKQEIVLSVVARGLIDFGEDDSAKQFLRKAIFLQPEDGYLKFCSLAQIEEGEESLNLYNRALGVLDSKYTVEINQDRKVPTLEQIFQMQAQNDKAGNQPADNSLTNEFKEESKETLQELCKPSKKDYVDILISIAEVALTDLWESNMELAKEKAIDALTKARNLSPNNHAVFLAYASYYMQLEDLKNAKEAVLQCLNIWEPIMVRIREKVTEEFSNREEEIEEDVMEEQILAKCELYVLDCESIGLLPNAENRLTVAKILYDVDEITRCDELINRELNLRVEDFEVHYLKARTSEKFGKFDDVRHSVLAAVYYGIDSGEIDVDSIGEVRDDLKELYVKANGDSDHIDRVISGALNGADPVELFQELDSSSSD